MEVRQSQADRVTAATDSSSEPIRKALPSWFADYLRGNFLSVAWQLALALGGVLLAMHFLYIGFFPDLDWQASLALLAVIALTGLCILAMVCLLLTFPSFTWTIFLEGLAQERAAQTIAPALTPVAVAPRDDEVSSPPESKDGDESIGRACRQEENRSRNDEPSWWKPGVLFGGPPAIFWLLFALAIWCWPEFVDKWPGSTLLVLFTVTLSAALLGYYALDGRSVLGSGFRPLSLRYYFPAVAIGVVISFVPLLLLYALAHSRYNASDMKPVTFLAAAMLGFLFNVAALQMWLRGGHRRGGLAGFTGAIFVGAVLLLGVVAATNNWVLLPEVVARLYGLGNIKGATLILDKEGCTIAKALDLITEPAPEGEMCRLPRVTILNRLGRIYYLESEGGTRFTLPAATVKSDKLRERDGR